MQINHITELYEELKKSASAHEVERDRLRERNSQLATNVVEFQRRLQEVIPPT